MEFQRRSGDRVAFNKLYRLAEGYLQAPGHRRASVVSQSPPEVQHSLALPAAQRLAPLLDMAASEDPALLAEVASVLAVMSLDPQVAAELRTASAWSAMRQLEKVQHVCAALPVC